MQNFYFLHKDLSNFLHKDVLMIFLHSYILYDINPPEGFNLRRDVYVRLAVFLKKLIKRDKEYQWQLVLPPWGNFYENERLYVLDMS